MALTHGFDRGPGRCTDVAKKDLPRRANQVLISIVGRISLRPGNGPRAFSIAVMTRAISRCDRRVQKTFDSSGKSPSYIHHRNN
jgi:hypothetical protein